MASAFWKFDFDNDAKWQQYKSSLEIPAGRDVEQVLTRFKAKWYRREIDPSFDVHSVLSSSTRGESQPTASTPSEPPSNGAKTQTRSPGSSSMPAQPKSLIQRWLAVLASNHQERLFFLHIALVAVFILQIQPFSTLWSYRAWTYFLQIALVTHGYKVYLKHGAPQLRPFSFAAIKHWAVLASATTDFQYTLIALVFLPSKPQFLVIVPMVTLAIYHVFAFASQNFASTSLWQRYGSRAHQWLLSHQQQALLYNAAAEIGAGFLIILQLLSPPRSFFLIFIYWQFLRMRYWSPDAANYHRMAWAQLDARFGTYLNYVPFLKMPIGYLQRWFQSMPQRQASQS